MVTLDNLSFHYFPFPVDKMLPLYKENKLNLDFYQELSSKQLFV